MMTGAGPRQKRFEAFGDTPDFGSLTVRPCVSRLVMDSHYSDCAAVHQFIGTFTTKLIGIALMHSETRLVGKTETRRLLLTLQLTLKLTLKLTLHQFGNNANRIHRFPGGIGLLGHGG
jgi:hypothetical protein